jgi:hypothetical protein
MPMLVGTTKLNYKEIKSFAGHPQDIVAYCESIIPIWALHIPNIIMNQRYYVAIHIRDMLSLPFKVRKELVDVLVKDITIVGVMSSFTSITDLVASCNKDLLLQAVEEEIKNANP